MSSSWVRLSTLTLLLTTVHFTERPDATQATRVLHVASLVSTSGPVASLGRSSQAAITAAVRLVNRAGGVKLADGTLVPLEVAFHDDRCVPAEGVSLMQAIARTDALLIIGPTCSSVAEAVYATLQPRLDGSAGAGIQVPVFTDGALKAGLASRSEWAFRNVANEDFLYREFWAWLRSREPQLRSVFGSEEADFAHSHSAWEGIIRPRAVDAGFTVLGAAQWSIADRTFAAAVAAMRAANPDVLALSAHADTLCGVLSEIRATGWRPKRVVGLTAAVTAATLNGCADAAKGMMIPTTFAETTAAAADAARAVAAEGGDADLISMSSWEIVQSLKPLIERAGIRAQPGSVAEDRRRLRDALATLRTTDGLLGPIRRTSDREAQKPYVFVEAAGTRWRIVHGPVLP